MADYTFAAARQFIFQVTVEGRQRLVRFSERNQFGASTFCTPDAKVAEAIRKTSMVKRGVIEETTPKEEKKPQGTAAQVARPAESPQPHEGVDDEVQPPDSKADVIEVDNFSQAKEAVAKRLGIDKSSIRTPPDLSAVAKRNGIIIKYRQK